ncbi:MAG: hypothetical protein IJW63_10605 [Lachnospiraceae bacterium]|nr:hypothetical protein [Lachnospiraceae bacterium]
MLANLAAMIWVIVAIEVIFGVLFVKEYQKGKSKMVLSMLLIDLGLFLDALFIVLGVFTQNGLPEMVSRLRFVSHGVLIPLMFPICGYGLKLGQKAMKILWAATFVIMVLGLAQSLAIHLELRQLGTVLRHVSADSSPAWAEGISSLLSYGTVIPLIIVGIIVWVKQKTPHLFLSGFLMFAFSALGPATGNFDLIFFISMIGEVFMVLFFYLYARVRAKRD